MRSFGHWKPRYVLARGREVIDHKLNPRNPWLTPQSVQLLNQLLRASDVALEFGSGRSTFWIAERVKQLTSVEHHEGWHGRGVGVQTERGIANLELLHIPMDVADSDGASSAYVHVLDKFAGNSLDFCLVDGMYRGHCAVGAVPKLKSGAVMAIDNAGWFLPSRSRCPNARALDSGPMDAVWQRFMDETSHWRRIWTTSDVTDTLILFKS